MAKVHFLEFELKLFLLIAAFLINNDSFFFLVRNISGCQVELTVGLSSLTFHTW